jgi:hypothetical protein
MNMYFYWNSAGDVPYKVDLEMQLRRMLTRSQNYLKKETLYFQEISALFTFLYEVIVYRAPQGRVTHSC